jgi:hypothetical protein
VKWIASKGMLTPLSCDVSVALGELQMDWMSSKDLKEKKVVTTPGSVARPKELLIQIDQRIAWSREIMEIMNQRKAKKESAKATLAEVIKETAKPRVAKSARERISAPSERSSNRGEQRSEVNYALASRPCHS